MIPLLMAVAFNSIVLVAGDATMTLTVVADNYADSKYPLSKYGHVPALYVGNSYDRGQDIWGSERIYLRFNLSAMPEGRLVTHATLRLWQYYAPASEQQYEVHRVLGDWNETVQSWDDQPRWASEKSSSARAPPITNVTVEWDITSDVQAWTEGKAVNYGIMIKAASEEHAADASSGFWSREYPVEEWKPKLILSLQGNPSSTYVAKLAVTGLPQSIASTLEVDGVTSGSISSLGIEIIFDKGTAHNLTVTPIISPSEGTRYRCADNQVRVTDTGFYIFAYITEYLVGFSADPSSLFQIPQSGWYQQGTSITANRTGPEYVESAPLERLAFDGWYVNSQLVNEGPGCLTCKIEKPTTFIVNGPMTIEGRYRKEYYLNVSSPIGETKGSGWYPGRSTASFSIDRTEVPAEGPLGLLGLSWTFVRWEGSTDFLGLPFSSQGSVLVSAPAHIVAVWQEDWSRPALILGILAVALVIALVMVARARRRQTTPPASTEMK